MAQPNLRDLPEELVSNISARLCIDDAQSLRLTCRALETKTLHEFATEYYSERAFPITASRSLKTLLAVADSPKLRGFLRTIYIITGYFSDSAFKCGPKTCCHGHSCGWHPTVRHSEAWKFLVQDAKDLKESGRAKDMLTKAISKLPSLEAITIVDSIASIPLRVDISMVRQLSRLCGRNFQLPVDGKSDPEYNAVLTHVWSTVTNAIASSNTTTLKRFVTNLAKGNNSLCIPSNIRFSDKKINLLKIALQSLEDLALQLSTRTGRNPTQKQKAILDEQVPNRMKNFASALPALRTLALDFDGTATDGLMFNNFMPHLDLSKMRKLELHTLTVDRKSIMAAIARLDSIQDLYLNYVDLSKGSWIPVLKQLQGMDGHLEHLHLMYLLESGKKAFFLAQPDEDEVMDEEDMMGYDDLFPHPEDDEEDDDDDDESLPPLETMDGEIVDADAGAPPSADPLPATVEDEPVAGPSSSADPMAAPPPAKKLKKSDAPKPGSPDYHATDDYKAPGNETYAERGYYVCIRGKEEISKELKKFVQEYNLGEYLGHEGMQAGLMGGGILGGGVIPIPVGSPGGQPPNMNNIMNGLAGYLGLPPMPGQQGGGHGGGHAHGAGAGGANHGAAPQGGGGQTGAANANNGGNAGGQQATGGAATNAQQGAAGVAGAAGAAGQAPMAHPPTDLSFLDGVMMPPGFDDFLNGGPPPPGVGAAAGAQMEDGWDTAESSEFESENEA